jgi:hypothetical protein
LASWARSASTKDSHMSGKVPQWPDAKSS